MPESNYAEKWPRQISHMRSSPQSYFSDYLYQYCKLERVELVISQSLSVFRKWRPLAKSASSVSNSIYVDQCKVRGNAQNREEPVRAEFTSSTIKCISYQSNIIPISFEKSYGPDPFILHSLVSGRVEALKEFNKYTYDRTERCSVLLAIRLQQCYIMGC